ncbi:copper amine oxidase [Nonomuraea sp. NPDC050394]|uniref:copper amine oxidase n=1 Tax=Nonomuraea sp. NPDC050394 TaxID=3364363 RepID=UPI0037ACEFF2
MFLQLALAVFVAAAGSVTPLASGTAPAERPCGSPYLIDRELPGGARWRLCWEMRTIEGLTLNRVTYVPKGSPAVSVLRSAALAQIHVPYDSGEPRYHDIGSLGSAAIPLTDADCPGGERRRQVVCVTTRPRGHAYLKDGFGDPALRRSKQGRELVVLSAYQVGWYTYIAEFVFGDDGSITPRVGATGSLAGTTTAPKHGWPIGVGGRHFEESHSHNVFWRMDFDIQGASRDVVEQYDFAGDRTKKRALKRTVLRRETKAVNRRMRWWRVVDPKVRNTDLHPVSWEINNSDSAQYRGPSDEAFTRADLYVTQYRSCERLATYNVAPKCGKSVDQYAGRERVKDPVIWVNVGYHHVARDEDADPMPVHWQGFRITPRDVTAKNPH